MPTGPLISVIIPCFKHAADLPKAVASVLDQTHGNVEAIVVDDGSPEDVPAAIARFRGDPRVRYFRQANRGLAGARNSGIRNARGSRLTFLDADDWLEPTFVAAHLAATEHHPGAVSYSGWIEVDPQGKLLCEMPAPAVENPLHKMLEGNFAPCHAFMTPTDAVLQAGLFDETLRSHEDWDLWLRIAAANREFIPVNGFLAVYQRVPGSMSTNWPRMVETAIQTLRKRSWHPNCATCRRLTAQRLLWWREEQLRLTLRAVQVEHGSSATLIVRMGTLARRDPALFFLGLRMAIAASGRRLRRAPTSGPPKDETAAAKTDRET